MKISETPNCTLYSDERYGYVATNNLYFDENIESRFKLRQAQTFDDEVYTYYGYSLTSDLLLKINASRCHNNKDSRLTMQADLYLCDADNISSKTDTNVINAAAAVFAAVCTKAKSVEVLDEETLISAISYLKVYFPKSMKKRFSFTTNDDSGNTLFVKFTNDPTAVGEEKFYEYISLASNSEYVSVFCKEIDKLASKNGLRFGVVELLDKVMSAKHAEEIKHQEERRIAELQKESETEKSNTRTWVKLNPALLAHEQIYFSFITPHYLAKDYIDVSRSSANEKELRQYLDSIAVPNNEFYRSYKALLLDEKSGTELMLSILLMTGDIRRYHKYSKQLEKPEETFAQMYFNYLHKYFSIKEVFSIFRKTNTPLRSRRMIIWSLIKKVVKRKTSSKN